MTVPEKHKSITKRLAARLKKKDVFEWLVTTGYYPESYVLPPCFSVSRHEKYGKVYTKLSNGRYNPKISELCSVHFPKSELTDRIFGVIDPEIHNDIAFHLCRNWNTILGILFHQDNKVCSYGFPIPLTSNTPGKLGKLRSGRMIYEFIEMAESDLLSEAYKYKFLIRTDIKNFYPSIYTHSIAWALHGKTYIRSGGRRNDYSFVGNKLDKLFQNANDGCTNGIAIGPAVSDLISELLLSRIDRVVSVFLKKENTDALIVRFKDDYRVLCHLESDAKKFIKILQGCLKEYGLELNEEKTAILALPDGIFRPWTSLYHAVNPRPKRKYGFKHLKEVYLSVISIDRQHPGTGVIDRFLSDLVTRDYNLRFAVDHRSVPKILSLLLMLGTLRTKAFPKVLGIIEAMLKTKNGNRYVSTIAKHLGGYLDSLASNEKENKYLIAWILYFLKSNSLESNIQDKYKFKDPIVRSLSSNRGLVHRSCKEQTLYVGIKRISKRKFLLQHLDVFQPQ